MSYATATLATYATMLGTLDTLVTKAEAHEKGEALLQAVDLEPEVQARVTHVNRFIDEMELQLFFRAADVAAFPYRSILTSGSLLMALSFGVPVVIPEFGMTREHLGLVATGQRAFARHNPSAVMQAPQAAEPA